MIIRQVCSENRVEILKGVLAADHVHMFVSIPPGLAISDDAQDEEPLVAQGAAGVLSAEK